MATASPLNIGQAADLVNVAIQNIFSKTSEPEVMYPKYFNNRTTTDYYEKDSSLSGLGEADFTAENADITEDVPVQGYDKTYTQNQIDSMVSFTFRMWKFGIKKRDIDNTASELKRAISRKKEKLCAERLTNGFESTSYTHNGLKGNTTITTSGGDSLGAFDDDHTREDGGTNQNNIVYDGTNSNLAFDYTALKAAHRTASLMVDPRGNPYPADLDTLVVKKWSTAHFKANEILGAIKKGTIPESMDNDGAAVPAFIVLPLDYLTESAYWFMFDKSRALTDKEGFQFVESQPAQVDPVNVVNILRPLWETIVEKFRKLRETLMFYQTIRSQVLLN